MSTEPTNIDDLVDAELDAAYFDMLDELDDTPSPTVDVLERTRDLLASFGLQAPVGLTEKDIHAVMQSRPDPEQGTLQVLLGIGGKAKWYASNILTWDKAARIRKDATTWMFSIGSRPDNLRRRRVDGRQLKWQIEDHTEMEDVLIKSATLSPAFPRTFHLRCHLPATANRISKKQDNIRPLKRNFGRILSEFPFAPELDWQPEIKARNEVHLSCAINEPEQVEVLRRAVKKAQKDYPNRRRRPQLSARPYFQAFVPATLNPGVGTLGFTEPCKVMQTSMRFSPTDELPDSSKVGNFFKLHPEQVKAVVNGFHASLSSKVSSPATA